MINPFLVPFKLVHAVVQCVRSVQGLRRSLDTTPSYRRRAKEKGCTCEWYGDSFIRDLDMACPCLMDHLGEVIVHEC